jgi:hypothetical protein
MQMVRKKTDVVQLKLRFSEALRRRLEREAKHQEWSLNREIISRLEESFRKSEKADLMASTFRAAWGEATGDLLRTIATAIWLIEKSTGKKWNEDGDTASEVERAIASIIEMLAFPPNSGRGLMFYGPFNADETEVARLMDAIQRGGVAALEALKKMGLAPSDAEIAAAKTVEARVQEVEKPEGK